MHLTRTNNFCCKCDQKLCFASCKGVIFVQASLHKIKMWLTSSQMSFALTLLIIKISSPELLSMKNERVERTLEEKLQRLAKKVPNASRGFWRALMKWLQLKRFTGGHGLWLDAPYLCLTVNKLAHRTPSLNLVAFVYAHHSDELQKLFSPSFCFFLTSKCVFFSNSI